MRHALSLALAALLLGGCASHKPEDYNGTWINQDAIDAADGGSLHQALSEHGPVLEWKIDVANQQASYSNGFEAVDGYLSAKEDQWQASFSGGQTEQLNLDGDTLRTTSQAGEKQTFVRVKAAPANAPLGGSFEKALYKAYLGGDWKIIEGPGKGAVVRFAENGRVTGLPNLDRYALCLAGDWALKPTPSGWPHSRPCSPGTAASSPTPWPAHCCTACCRCGAPAARPTTR